MAGIGIVLGFALVVTGCGSTPWAESGWQERPHDPGPQYLAVRDSGDLCDAYGSTGSTGGFRLALPGSLDPENAPWPKTAAETHVFRNLYETLVRVDCAGEIRPGLATRWAAFDHGRIWEFHLRRDAVFWNGTPVTAERVLASWRWTRSAAAARGLPSPLRLFDPGGADVLAAAPDRLVVRLAEPSDTLLLELAHPALAVAAASGADRWPLGSGPCRPEFPAAPAVSVVLRPHADHPDRPAWPQVEILADVLENPAALVDDGCHAMVLRDRDALAAARRISGLSNVALPHDRVYVLITPPRNGERTEEERQRWTTEWNGRALAQEIVRTDARPSDDIFLADPGTRLCAGTPVAVPALDWPNFGWPEATTTGDRDLVLFPADRAEAGRLAEYLAELAAVPRGASDEGPGRGPLTRDFPPEGGFAPQAVAVPPAEFAGALQSARAGAYVVPLDWQAPTACGQIASLIGRAEWLQDAAFDRQISAAIVPPSATAPRPAEVSDVPEAERMALRLGRERIVLPLVKTRAHLVQVRGLVGLRAEFDGALDLRHAGWLPGYGP